MDVSAEENSCLASPETENQPVLIIPEHPSHVNNEGEVDLNSCSESTPKMKTSDIKETEKTKETPGGNLKVRYILTVLKRM